MNLIARRCLNRSRLVEELVETWQIWHGSYFFSDPELDKAVSQLQTIKDEIESIWPEFDRAMIEKSLASYKKGDFKTIEDFLHEAQSGVPQRN